MRIPVGVFLFRAPQGVAVISLTLKQLADNPRSIFERGLSHKLLWFKELVATPKVATGQGGSDVPPPCYN